MKTTLLVFGTFLFFLITVRADLPIHCLHSQVHGKWKIMKTNADHAKMEMCGYKHPDTNNNHFHGSYNYKIQHENSILLDLRAPNQVYEANAKEASGSWTMVYDEGVEIKHKGHTYFAFMEYGPKQGIETNDDDKVEDYTSNCHKTRVGWYHDGKDTNFGCFKAHRLNAEPQQAQPGSLLSLEDNDYKRPHRNQEHLGHVSRVSTELDDDLFEPDYAFVEMVNADDDSTWTAAVHDHFVGQTMGHMHKLRGRRSYHRHLRADQDRVAVKPMPLTAEQQREVDNLPKAIDWRNCDGKNYMTGMARDQGGCGSCYAIASATAVSARLNILNNRGTTPNSGLFLETGNATQKPADKQFKMSPQDIMACSSTNQGCAGGYPFLVGRYGTTYGFVDEDCMKYQSSDTPKCEKEEKKCLSWRHKAADYQYIGGYYGGSSPGAMLMELQKGPVPVAIEAPSDFFYYRGGVYDSKEKPTGKREKQKGEEGKVRTWEQVNHAIVLLGYGTEKKQTKQGTKDIDYWIIQNSWGAGWGENGYAKIRRGKDLAAIESMGVSINMKKAPAQVTLFEKA